MIAKYGNNVFKVGNNYCNLNKQWLQSKETVLAKWGNNDSKVRKQCF